MLNALKKHWPEYLMEAAELGHLHDLGERVHNFAVSSGLPGSPCDSAKNSSVAWSMGLAMGLTAVGIIYSPWGKQSGAHMNPAFTLTFFRLGKVAPWDAMFLCARAVCGRHRRRRHRCRLRRECLWPSRRQLRRHACPAQAGPGAAFAGEVVISFLLLLVVLTASNQEKLASFTGLIRRRVRRCFHHVRSRPSPA